LLFSSYIYTTSILRHNLDELIYTQKNNYYHSINYYLIVTLHLSTPCTVLYYCTLLLLLVDYDFLLRIVTIVVLDYMCIAYDETTSSSAVIIVLSFEYRVRDSSYGRRFRTHSLHSTTHDHTPPQHHDTTHLGRFQK
jgi:hypothetical protein